MIPCLSPRPMVFCHLMTETKLSFSIDIGDVLDVDFRADGSLISLQGFDRRQVIVFEPSPPAPAEESVGREKTRIEKLKAHRSLPPKPIELPNFWSSPEYPHFRYLKRDRLLVIDNSSQDVYEQNALVMSESGNLISRFHVGAGVVEVCPTGGGVAVAYHCEAAYEFGHTMGEAAAAGVAVYDLNGQMIASLNSDLEEDGWHLENIQCMIARESGELILIPEFLYGPQDGLNSPIIFYDWRSGKIRIEESRYPRPLAVSSRGSTLLVYAPETSEDEIVKCDLHGDRLASLGHIQNIYRGLSGGKFLSQLSGIEYRLFDFDLEPETRKLPAAPIPIYRARQQTHVES